MDFLSDDAYISFRYAENFAAGKGLVYNEGEVVEGYTNFLWVIIMSVIAGTGADMLAAARAIGLLSGVAFILITYYLSANVFRISPPVSYLSAFLVALNPGFVLWSYSGMETLFFSVAVMSALLCVILFIGSKEIRLLYISSVIFLLASLIRPEGVLFFASAFGYVFFSMTAGEKAGIVSALKKLGPPAFIFAACYGIYFAWRFDHYGLFLPNTFYAKTGFEDQQLKGFYYCYKFVRESLAGGILLIFPAYSAVRMFSDARIRFILFILLVYLSYIIFVGGDNLLVQRFFVPVLPLIFTLLALGVYRLMGDLKTNLIVNIIVFIALLIYPVSVLLDTRSFPMLGVERTMLHYENMKKAGLWLRDNSEKHETVAVESAGIIPYFSGLKSYDRLGLNDLHISHHGKYGEGERDKSDEEYIVSVLRPDYYVDAFPTLEVQSKPDIARDSIVYVYHSVHIGEGVLEERTGVRETGDLYFNYYRKMRR